MCSLFVLSLAVTRRASYSFTSHRQFGRDLFSANHGPPDNLRCSGYLFSGARTRRQERYRLYAAAPDAGKELVNEMKHILRSDIEYLLEILRRERNILDDLQSRIRQAGAFMATEREASLADAARQIAEVEEQLGTAEMLRAVVVAGIAERWGIPEYDLSLRSIIKRVPTGQAEVLGRDLDHLREITRSVESLRSSTASVARRRLEMVQQATSRA